MNHERDLKNPEIFPYYQTSKLLNPLRDSDDIFEEFERLGLTTEFIDWVSEAGFRIVFSRYMLRKRGGVNYQDKEINVYFYWGEPLESINVTIVHELIHIATPRTSDRETIASLFYREYENVIDKIAEAYSRNTVFMDYVRNKIPTVFVDEPFPREFL